MMKFFEGKENLANLFLRIGLALTLLWSVNTKFTATDKVVGLFQKLGLTFASSGLIQFVAIVLLISAILLLVGAYVRPVGILLTGFFLVTVLLGIGSGFAIGPALWKDFAFLGGALAITFGGSGAYGFDTKKGR